MKIKYGVKLEGLKIQMRYVMIEADALWKEFNQECVITSGTEIIDPDTATFSADSTLIHSPKSLHPFGYALDLRTFYFSEVDKVRVMSKLQIRLNKISTQYSVILEKTHIHVEWRGFIK